MIKVKLTTYDYSPSTKEDFLKQTPNLSGKWEGFQFYINQKIDICDYWVVFDCLPKEESTNCPKENTIFIAGEPSSIKKYNEQFLSQFSKIITCQRRIKYPKTYYMAPGHTWRTGKSYDELFNNDKVEKNKLISIVVSNKSGTPGHKKRLEFCLNLKKYFGDKIDIFGRGINDFEDKWDVLAPYKYSIAIENSVEQDWMTEKIGDCFTTLTFPFYYGCPNIDKYYSRDSYQLIDIDDFEGTCKTIEEIINDEKHYEQHLNCLIGSKKKYLNQYYSVPLIANFIKSEYKKNKKSVIETITLKPEKNFEYFIEKYSIKIFNKIKNKLSLFIFQINLFLSKFMERKHKKRYFIVGKKIKEGNLESDSENGALNEYFELGWEYAVSHLHIKHLFSVGKLNDDDVIVTIKDRMFLYEGFWNNVMSYEDFCSKNINDSIVDLCDLIQKNPVGYIPKLDSDNKYEYFESDKDVIKNIKYKDISYLNTDEPYCCLHIRYRKWASFRNLPKKFWEEIIKKIESSGLKIYIFGKEAKEFANRKNIFHVSLDEYASLLNNKNCKYLIGNMSGGTLVAQTFSHDKCKNYVIIADNQTYTEYMDKNSYQIFYHIEEFNFAGSPISYVSFLDDTYDDTLISVEKLMNEI